MASMFKRKEILEMCQILAEQEQLKISVKESVKGGIIAGIGAVVGGLLGGPIGLAIGGTIGSATAAICAAGKFRSVADILENDLTARQKEILISNMSTILSTIRPHDFLPLITLVMSSHSMKQMVIQGLGEFLLKELSLTMIQ
ncbi:uncharacterized protein [Diabrotica undecimpunctata]|uniref:uncharacterized protein n=1 Tax=Diabrotica undecimpunctata TaxID=50387 RepID=UPI003B63B72B